MTNREMAVYCWRTAFERGLRPSAMQMADALEMDDEFVEAARQEVAEEFGVPVDSEEYAAELHRIKDGRFARREEKRNLWVKLDA